MTLLGLMAGWSGGVREQAWRSASRARRWDWTICRLLLLALVWQCPQTAACRKSVGGAERDIFRENSLSDASLRRLRRVDYHSEQLAPRHSQCTGSASRGSVMLMPL